LNNVEIYDGVKINMILKPLKTLKPNGKPDQLLLISNIKANKRAMDSYKKRWSIEVFPFNKARKTKKIMQTRIQKEKFF